MRVAVLLCSALLAAPAVARTGCAAADVTVEQAAALQNDAFRILTVEDRAAWEALASDDFVAHENGKAYDRTGFFDLLAGAHRAGTGLKWAVSEPVLEARCGLALLSYVNSGVVTKNGVSTPTRWLETSAFRWSGGRWRLFHVTSMLVRP